jgi:hypothetical protein
MYAVKSHRLMLDLHAGLANLSQSGSEMKSVDGMAVHSGICVSSRQFDTALRPASVIRTRHLDHLVAGAHPL